MKDDVFSKNVILILRNGEKVMGIKGRRVHLIEEISDTVISFQRGKNATTSKIKVASLKLNCMNWIELFPYHLYC